MADNKTSIIITARDETREAFARISSGLAGISAAAQRLPLIGTALAGAFSGAALVSGVKSIIDGADQLNKASQKYGVAVEQLSALSYAGKLSDVSLEAIGTGLKKLSMNMLDAAAGTGEAKEAFKALGVEIRNADGSLRSSDDVLGQIADRFAGMEDGAGKTALAVRLFGRSGADLIPLLNQGSKGLAEMREEAARFGAVVGGDLARKSEEFNDNLTRLSTAFGALGIAMVQGALPHLNLFVERLLAGIKAAGGFWEALKSLGTINPLRNTQENLRAYSDELERIERRLAYAIPAAERKSLEASAETLRVRLRYLRDAAQIDANARISERNLDARDLALRSVGEKKAPAPVLSDAEKKKVSAGLREIEDYSMRIRSAVGEAITNNDVTRAREFADKIEFLDRLFFDAGLDAEIYAAALNKLSGTAARTAHEKDRLNDLLAHTPSAQLDKIRDDMTLLAQAFEDGKISYEAFLEAVTTRLPKIEASFDEMTEFARQAARNMQDAMADGFFDVMQGKFDDLAGSLKRTIDRMVANLMASQLMDWLTGDFGRTGRMGGVLGMLFGSLFGGARASGGPVAAGRAYLVGENGPELFMPRQSGTIIPGGGAVTVYNNFTIQGTVDRRSQQQIAAEVGAAVDRALRRNR